MLLDHLARPTTLLNERDRAYARDLMATVRSSQTWGVSAGPRSRAARVELKNGRLSADLPRLAGGSTGHVSGEGRDYLIAVLTMDNPTMRRGVATVNGVSKIVWRDLDPQGRPRDRDGSRLDEARNPRTRRCGGSSSDGCGASQIA